MEADAYTYEVILSGLREPGHVTANSLREAREKAKAVYGLMVQHVRVVKPECSECGSRGFETSVTGKGCQFCDGTFAGNPPGQNDEFSESGQYLGTMPTALEAQAAEGATFYVLMSDHGQNNRSEVVRVIWDFVRKYHMKYSLSSIIKLTKNLPKSITPGASLTLELATELHDSLIKAGASVSIGKSSEPAATKEPSGPEAISATTAFFTHMANLQVNYCRDSAEQDGVDWAAKFGSVEEMAADFTKYVTALEGGE